MELLGTDVQMVWNIKEKGKDSGKMKCTIRPSCRILTKEGNPVSHQTSQLTEDTEIEDTKKEKRGVEGWERENGMTRNKMVRLRWWKSRSKITWSIEDKCNKRMRRPVGKYSRKGQRENHRREEEWGAERVWQVKTIITNIIKKGSANIHVIKFKSLRYMTTPNTEVNTSIWGLGAKYLS